MNLPAFPSRLLENAVNEFATLPGIGRKTAFRLVMHLLRREEADVTRFGEAVIRLRKEVSYCRECHNISDNDICNVCSDPSRDKSTVCVVENIQDVMAIENTRQYRGVYHVLGGIISPVDGIGPGELNIPTLVARAESGEVTEVILALSTTMEGDTTNYYLFKKLAPSGIEVTTLARGVSMGDELEYIDELTLGRSLVNRTPFSFG
jgi:recombination protein RecR